MGAAFRQAVSTDARRTLNLVVAPQTRCLAGEPTTARTGSPEAEPTTRGVRTQVCFQSVAFSNLYLRFERERLF
jgi:hypothetical protein